MSRNFGIPGRRPSGLPRERLVSEDGIAWIKAGLGGLMALAFMVVLVLLEIEFPNGLAPFWNSL